MEEFKEFSKFLINYGKYVERSFKMCAVDVEKVPGMRGMLKKATNHAIDAPLGINYSYFEKVVTAKENFQTANGVESLPSFCFKTQSKMIRDLSERRQGLHNSFSDLTWQPLSKDYTLTMMQPYGPKNNTEFVPAGTVVHVNEHARTVTFGQAVLPAVDHAHQASMTTFASIGDTHIDEFKFGKPAPSGAYKDAPIESIRRLQTLVNEDLQLPTEEEVKTRGREALAFKNEAEKDAKLRARF